MGLLEPLRLVDFFSSTSHLPSVPRTTRRWTLGVDLYLRFDEGT